MNRRQLVPEDIYRLFFVSDVQFSPDAQEAVCCIKSTRSPGSYKTELYKLVPGESPALLVGGDDGNSQPRWSPSGDALAFISDREKPESQIYLVARGSSDIKRLSSFQEGKIIKYSWSPDGSKLAVLFRPTAPERTKAAAEKRKELTESEPPIEVTNWPYRWDGEGYFHNQVAGLYLLDIDTGEHGPVLTDTDRGDIQFEWMPSGEQMVVAFQPGKDRFADPYTNELFILDLATCSKEPIITPLGEKSALSVDPAGKLIACVLEDRAELPWGPKTHEVLTVEIDSGKQRRYLAEEDLFLETHVIGDARDPADTKLFWAFGGESLVFQVAERGRQYVGKLDLESGNFSKIAEQFPGEIHLTSMAGLGTFGAFVTSTKAPAEAYQITLNPSGSIDLFQLTDFNKPLLDELNLGEPEEIRLETEDKSVLQGWILRPFGFDGRKSYSAVIEVHGGPLMMYTSAFFFEMQLLAANGFVVAFCNPRGSSGYGQEYARSILHRWGTDDWTDVQTLTKYVASLPYIDKVCIAGGSYGGFMVNWAISHSNSYYRAVTDRCVSNLLSKFGNSDYIFVPDGNWKGAVFGDYEHLWECSPIKHFGNARTPTLVVHSEGDLRCNIEQGEQVYAALKLLGVETKMIRYPQTTSHGMSRNGPPDLRVHRLKSIVDWLKR